MPLGFDVHEDSREFESQSVTRYTTTKLEYPCYIVDVSDTARLRKYAVDVLHNMFQIVEYMGDEEHKAMINLYFSDGTKMVKYGVIHPRNVKAFLDLFKENKITGYFEDGTLLESDLLYVLSD